MQLKNAPSSFQPGSAAVSCRPLHASRLVNMLQYAYWLSPAFSSDKEKAVGCGQGTSLSLPKGR